MSKSNETKMVLAHISGRAAYRQGEPMTFTRFLLTEEERLAYAAGWIGESKRHAKEVFAQARATRAAVSQTFEPIRPLRAPDNGAPYYAAPPMHATTAHVDYGQHDWPSRSYWLIPTNEESI